VEFVVGNPPDHVAKLIAARGQEPPFDVITSEESVKPILIKDGLVQKIDPNIVTNLNYIFPQARDKDGYGPSVAFVSIGIAYNAKILADKGLAPPTKWADLWRPEFAGKIAIPDIAMSTGMATVAIASLHDGGPDAPADPTKAMQTLAEIKAAYFYQSSADLASKFASGDVWIAPWYPGRTVTTARQGVPLKYVAPTDGPIASTGMSDVVAGSKMVKEANEYINQSLDPYSQLCFVHYVHYGPVNVTLAEVVKAYPEISASAPVTPKEIQAMRQLDWATIVDNYPKWVDLWNRIVRK
jgi:putative spermidine/putrescine transport system substrate-binding protein